MGKIHKSRTASYLAIGSAVAGIYLLLFGPALWCVQNRFLSVKSVATSYRPWLELEFQAPRILQDSVTLSANLFRTGPALARVRDVPLWRSYFVGDLAYRLLDCRQPVNALEELCQHIIYTVEAVTWDEVGGFAKIQVEPGERSINVFQTRQSHEILTKKLAKLRAFKSSKRHVRDLDLIALIRMEFQSDPAFRGRYGHELKQELLARAIIVNHADKSTLVDNWRSFTDVAQLLDFLDRQSRATLRRGVFWDVSHTGPELEVADRLRAYCRAKDIDMFIEWPCTGSYLGAMPSPEIKWEVQASDSDYAL